MVEVVDNPLIGEASGSHRPHLGRILRLVHRGQTGEPPFDLLLIHDVGLVDAGLRQSAINVVDLDDDGWRRELGRARLRKPGQRGRRRGRRRRRRWRQRRGNRGGDGRRGGRRGPGGGGGRMVCATGAGEGSQCDEHGHRGQAAEQPKFHGVKVRAAPRSGRGPRAGLADRPALDQGPPATDAPSRPAARSPPPPWPPPSPEQMPAPADTG